VNALANRLPLGGYTTGELSALYPNLIVPAGFTFSIWGVIYLLLIGWSVGQFTKGGSDAGRAIARWFALSSVLNAAWLLAWHYRYPGLSVLVMLGLLGVLLRLNHELAKRPAGVPWLARAAFGVYLGWVIVATVVNVTAWFVSLGWSGDPVPATAWALALLPLGAALALLSRFGLRNPFVGLAVAWAFGGIAANRWYDVPIIAWTAVAMAVVVAGATLAGGGWRGPIPTRGSVPTRGSAEPLPPGAG
jgi:translocator protein